MQNEENDDKNAISVKANRKSNSIFYFGNNFYSTAPPKFVQELSDSEVQIDHPTQLMVRVVGNPEPTLTWFHNGKIIEEKMGFKMERDGNEYRLSIKETKEEMGGAYSVEAVNTIGKASSHGSVTILGKI